AGASALRAQSAALLHRAGPALHRLHGNLHGVRRGAGIAVAAVSVVAVRGDGAVSARAEAGDEVFAALAGAADHGRDCPVFSGPPGDAGVFLSLRRVAAAERADGT